MIYHVYSALRTWQIQCYSFNSQNRQREINRLKISNKTKASYDYITLNPLPPFPVLFYLSSLSYYFIFISNFIFDLENNAAEELRPENPFPHELRPGDI